MCDIYPRNQLPINSEKVVSSLLNGLIVTPEFHITQKTSSMEDFPDSLLLDIFSFLNYEDLCLGVRMTCCHWRQLTFDQQLWKRVEIPEHFTHTRFILLLKQISRHVEDLDCTKCETLTEDAFLCLSSLELPRLKKLSIPILGTYPDYMYEAMSKTCPKLEEVENVRPNVYETCNVLKSQALFHDLKVVHDKPVSSYGRIRKIGPDSEKQKRILHVLWKKELTALVNVCQKVKEYRCNRGMEYIDNVGMERLSTIFPKLSHLELRHCSVTDEGFVKFFSKSGNPVGLTEIIMDKPGDITDKGLKVIADFCPNLKNIKISRCIKVTPEGINYLVEKCNNITELHVNNSQAMYEESDDVQVDIDDACLDKIGANCPNMQYFRLFYSKVVSVEGVGRLTEGCRYIQGLMFFECPLVEDSCMKELMTNLKFLKALVLVNCNVTPKGIVDYILVAPGLTRLTLYANTKHFYADMSDLAEETYNKIDEHTDRYRPNVIKRITLRGVGGGFLQLLTVLCPKLNILDIRDGNVLSVHSLVTVLRNCEMLRHLDISSVPQLDDEFMKAVAAYALELRHLALGATVRNMTNTAIADVIKRCPSLSMISMDTYGSQVDHVDEETLIQTARRHHGGHCYLHIDPDCLKNNPENRHRYIELHFTPIKYLGSIFTVPIDQ